MMKEKKKSETISQLHLYMLNSFRTFILFYHKNRIALFISIGFYGITYIIIISVTTFL